MKKQLFFGTNNPNKLREIREILENNFEVLGMESLEEAFDVEETEPTLEGNAELKARAFYKKMQIPCFSDDTGLEVDALDGAPGVISARYAGPDCKPEDNIRKLLEVLGDRKDRKARFRTVIAYFDGKQIECFEGIVEGRILMKPQGKGGFGYDPVFAPDGDSRSFAEYTPAEKNRISHRGKAIRAFTGFLRTQA